MQWRSQKFQLGGLVFPPIPSSFLFLSLSFLSFPMLPFISLPVPTTRAYY